jgi:hypothetical protein
LRHRLRQPVRRTGTAHLDQRRGRHSSRSAGPRGGADDRDSQRGGDVRRRNPHQVWNAECAGGRAYGVVAKADSSMEIVPCSALEALTGSKCFEKF